MRLLLDEHLDPRLAEKLRARGHDALAVAEDPALHGLSDPALLDHALVEGRAIVTYDAADFSGLAEERQVAGEPFAGIVFVSTRAFPPGRRGHGRVVQALVALLKAHPSRSALAGRIVRLSDPVLGRA